MKNLTRLVLWFALLILCCAALLAGSLAWWGWMRVVPMESAKVDYLVEAGSTPRQMAQSMHAAGIGLHDDSFVWLARISGLDKQLKAGAYEAREGDTLWALLQRMASGDMTQVRLTFPEGWTFAQFRQALANSEQVRHDAAGFSDQELLAALGLQASSPEGLFHPDTYVFSPGTPDLDILRRAARAGEQILQQAWESRDPDLPLANSYEALILASIIEKETGLAADRRRIAGVFINRLRIGMPLQTDPTVIYGMGDRYQGRIRKRDLTTDTPWNTYTRAGLPPTPIASPGKDSLLAALHPEEHDYLYFVSRGDGSSEFSRNLPEHNRAVSKFILNRK